MKTRMTRKETTKNILRYLVNVLRMYNEGRMNCPA